MNYYGGFKSMDGLVSVIVPIYNIEKYIGRCIESIVNQTYNNIEVLLVVDGATDNSLNICKCWAKKDSRIRVIYQENGGVSSARNHGVKESKGEYITFVDGDDYIANQMIEKLVESIKNNNVDFSVCNLCVIHMDGKMTKVNLKSQVFDVQYIIENYFDNNNIKEIMWGPNQKLFKRSLIKDFYFKNYSMGEDLLYIFEILQTVSKLAYVDYDGYYYVHRENSAMKSNFSNKNFDYIKAAEEIVNICKNNSSVAIYKANQWFYKTALVLFRSLIINNSKNDFYNEYTLLKCFLKKNKKEYLKQMSFKRKMDFYLSIYFSFVYKIFLKVWK